MFYLQIERGVIADREAGEKQTRICTNRRASQAARHLETAPPNSVLGLFTFCPLPNCSKLNTALKRVGSNLLTFDRLY